MPLVFPAREAQGWSLGLPGSKNIESSDCLMELECVSIFGFGGGGVGFDGVGWAFGEDLLHGGVVAIEVVEEVDLAVLVDAGGEVEDDDGERVFEVDGAVVGTVVHGVL